ncbi:hypothetical protein UPYG_G00274090 [Umbra pygmaea]|uniref:Dual specificity protein phosphatase 16 n=1 Tax=Umbra pygmaea TaxID=75934 RepID=A0ABD0WMJ1_UMBPY
MGLTFGLIAGISMHVRDVPGEKGKELYRAREAVFGPGAHIVGGASVEIGSGVGVRGHSGLASGSINGTHLSSVHPIGAEGLVALLERGLDSVLLIDSRPFVEYNSAHILEAVNVNCSKLMKRRLQQDKVQVNELLQHSAKKKLELTEGPEVVVYDQTSSDPLTLPSEAFLTVLLAKLERSFPSVHLLSGLYGEVKALLASSCLVPSCLSQPCLPLNTSGPTRILPHLYLGCQRDVLNKELMQQNDIAYVLNASNTCPKPDYIPESHFLRVPVNDSFCEKILPWLDRSVEFIEKAKASNACVLVHCLAGISRSATIAIAYIMKRMDMSLDEAYRFVKEKRPTISPNFNFLGQLLDFEKKIKTDGEAELKGVKPPMLPPYPPLEQPGPGNREDNSRSTTGLQDFSVALLEPMTLPCMLAPRALEDRLLAPRPLEDRLLAPRPLEDRLLAPRPLEDRLLAPRPLEDRLLAQALHGLQLDQGTEDSARLKRSFSLDIKSYGEPDGCSSAPLRSYPQHAPHPGDQDYYKPSTGFKEPANVSKPCQFSPVEEVSEQSTPEQSPDKEQADAPADPSESSDSIRSTASKQPGTPPPSWPQKLHCSGSMEETLPIIPQNPPTISKTPPTIPHNTSFLFGLSRSQQHLSKPAPNLGSTLKGWHSDILLAPVTVSSGGWYLSESHRFYSTSTILGGGGSNILGGGGFAAYSMSQGFEEVRRRGRQRSGDHGGSRRSWHEESTFEKQLKRRSCQMEFGDGRRGESVSREEMGSQSSFSGSVEVIEVS